MRYFKNLLSDLRSGRLALHPILLATTFCVIRISGLYLVSEKLQDYHDLDILEWFSICLLYDFTQCVCFVVIGAHFAFVAGCSNKNNQNINDDNASNQALGLQRLAILRATLYSFIFIACVVGYITADINYQKLNVLNYFLPTMLTSALIYLIAIQNFMPVAWFDINTANYAEIFSVLLRWASVVLAIGLALIWPPALSSYFRYAYKKRLAEEMCEA